MMNAHIRSGPQKQRGILTAMAAVILIAAVLYVLSQSFGIIGTTSESNVTQRDSVSAFFVAESGVEVAKAVLTVANENGTNLDTACPGLATGAQSISGVSGTYEVKPTPVCSGTGCSECTLDVEGKVNDASRAIRITISTTNEQGSTGCGSSPILSLSPSVNGPAIFTNLAYRAKPFGTCGASGSQSNAQLGSCNLSYPVDPTACNPGYEAYYVEGTGTNAISALGVLTHTSLPSGGTYTITETLVPTGGGLTVEREYVQTGVMIPPMSGKTIVAENIGAYGSGTGSNKTSSTSGITGSVPSTWNCRPNSTTANNSEHIAAGMNTLLYGFSGLASTGFANALDGVTLGVQPLRRLLYMPSTGGDLIYSQIWFSFNEAYYSTDSSGANNGAAFTGAVGAEIQKGSIVGTILTVDAGDLNYGQLRPGDTLAGTGVTAGTKIVSCTGNNYATPPLTCTLDQTSTVIAKAMTVSSNVLRTSPVTRVIRGNDIVATGLSGLPVIQYGTAGSWPATWGTGGSGDYLLVDGSGSPVVTAPVNSQAMQSSGTTITLGGSAIETPTQGTALAVASGTGTFSTTTVPTGTISGLNLSGVPIGTNLYVGDALFGPNVKPRTYITSYNSGSGTGTVSINQAATGPFLARAAVLGIPAPGPTSYVVSRRPTTALSGAQLCGGVCAMLLKGSDTTFTLSPSSIAGYDWGSGFACVGGVDPDGIKVIGRLGTKRTSWSEVVR